MNIFFCGLIFCSFCWISLGASDDDSDVDVSKEDFLVVKKNVTDLWETFTEFRQAVSNHLHRLHEYQVNNQVVIQNLLNKPRVGKAGAKGLKAGLKDNRTYEFEDFVPRSFKGPPKVRDPEDYDFAICVLSANSALPPEKKEGVRGVVKFFQKRKDPTLHVYVRVKGFNVLFSNNIGKNGSEENLHSLHVHEKADFSKGCESLGDYYKPINDSDTSEASHVGDFGNLEVDEDGGIHLIFVNSVASLKGKDSIIGKSLVIHGTEEDRSDEDLNSLTSKSSDKRIACCVIEKTQYQ